MRRKSRLVVSLLVCSSIVATTVFADKKCRPSPLGIAPIEVGPFQIAQVSVKDRPEIGIADQVESLNEAFRLDSETVILVWIPKSHQAETN
jgi:hypothetical protein